MTSDKGILIKNIYYMLTYAFQSLRQSNYDKVVAEEFENIHDMFAAIFGKGVASQLKQGSYKGVYIAGRGAFRTSWQT